MKPFYCPQCGAMCREDSQFCQHCGYHLAAAGSVNKVSSPVRDGGISSSYGVSSPVRQSHQASPHGAPQQYHSPVATPGYGNGRPQDTSYSDPAVYRPNGSSQESQYTPTFQPQHRGNPSAYPQPVMGRTADYPEGARPTTPARGNPFAASQPSNKSGLGRLLILVLVLLVGIGVASYFLYDALMVKNQVPVEALTGTWSGYLLAEDGDSEDVALVNEFFHDFDLNLNLTPNGKGTAQLAASGLSDDIPLQAEYSKNTLTLTYADGSERLQMVGKIELADSVLDVNGKFEVIFGSGRTKTAAEGIWYASQGGSRRYSGIP
ncbi:MAG TPA: hypothetical protein GX717_07110 [Clostridiaceae bacterium]|nr:hypothetical protein [Clostridiaceae bacterium]